MRMKQMSSGLDLRRGKNRCGTKEREEQDPREAINGHCKLVFHAKTHRLAVWTRSSKKNGCCKRGN
jgi:hypothetical protein